MTSLSTNSSFSGSASLPSFASSEWLIRLSVAATFIYHGLDKFPNIAGGAEFMGMPYLLWLAVALGEIAAGAALIVGGLVKSPLGDIVTRLGGLGVSVIMVGAIALVHWGQWSALPSETHPVGGMEFQTLLLAIGVFYTLRGNRA